MLKTWVYRWSPAALLMVVIFVLSARPSTEMPSFGIWDYFVKKGGHVAGYGLLALTYWRGLGLERGGKWLAWGLAICYAITDEIHQSFVPGRHPALWDVILFDNFGALIFLWLAALYRKQKRLDAMRPVAAETKR